MARFIWATCCLSLATFLASCAAQSFTNTSDFIITTAAINAMMSFYNSTDGRWDTSAPWWESGVALRTLVDYMRKTQTSNYMSQVQYTIDTQRKPLSWWPAGGGDFRADSTDDTGWWALAMTSMYQLTGNTTFLDIAIEDEAYMFNYWTEECGGGLIWEVPTRSYKSAISNELYLELTATLHNLMPGDTFYLERSLMEWEWLQNSDMINSDWLVNDGLMKDAAGKCVNNKATTWTYNQGVILGGLVELYQATGENFYINTARKIADAVTNSSELSPNGTLTEPCSSAADCEPNGGTFKGIFIRHLAKLNEILAGRPYSKFIRQNARSVHQMAGDGNEMYGMKWQGPFDTRTIARQVSAVNLFVAALGV